MIKKRLAHLKPGVPKRIHLLWAAILWTCIGLLLISRGANWVVSYNQWWIVVVALVLGSCKSYFILDRFAKKGIQRILNFADGTCLGAVYSLKTWMLVFCMIIAGFFMRHSSLPRPLLSLMYITVGWGLLLSSRHAWLSWKNLIDQKSKNDK